jgi:hypothetical protein
MSDPNAKNPTGLLGIDFVELASPDPGACTGCSSPSASRAR